MNVLEANQHEGSVSVRDALARYPGRRHLATPERMADLLARVHGAMQLMEDHLAVRDWLVGDTATQADICLYAYTHSAGRFGGFDMMRFAAALGQAGHTGGCGGCNADWRA